MSTPLIDEVDSRGPCQASGSHPEEQCVASAPSQEAMSPCRFRCQSRRELITPSMLRTGDIILVREPSCGGCDNCILQNCCCWGANHVGIALHPLDFGRESHLRTRHPALNSDHAYILHAVISGVKVWEMERYLQKQVSGCTKGVIYVRRLQFENSSGVAGELAMRSRLASAVDALFGEVQDRPFERNWWSIVQSFCDACEFCGFCEAQRDLSSVFCSELVAEALQRGGVLSGERASAEFLPVDFWRSDGRVIERACLAEHVSLSDILQLDSDTSGSSILARNVTLVQSASLQTLAAMGA
eukprot:TRINITY_DN11022_c0_g1_i1.p1 TRINITY_DN11022_c0_g1~~TRINITY_DN11022_c0_g1_i1.p1  ORF type:complete len:300 (-),score=47.88 TRINITY_DN11022_c0_g1_i1:153-1052(-)